ncbi:sensor histidine kinase [Halanaeroarchaeum sulfurireducens]|uniref:histidine kinase n=1 Tax=Halanaeroarchaeum sulfurireducens TaxID=1604004 RepID=A0A0N7FTB6_9EURY|nr:HAMP domain-containing sensor histidine kinase [Halanaeroarchaeum sulfurireducens]ALG81103.1 histidine kinase [Halanaeroarchaeum sulfurireducens]
MVSKGDLGTAYFITVGAVLFATIGTGVAVPHAASGYSMHVHSPLPIVTALTIAIVFTGTGLWMRQNDLNDGIAWPIAIWASIGLAVPVLVLVALSLWNPPALGALDWQDIASLNIAFGGMVGILSGTLLGLRSEYERKETLYQRNTVFLRLFRHDIRNSINVVRGHVDLLADGDDRETHSTDIIEEELDHIVRLGEAARILDRLDSMETTETVDLAALVRERVAEVRADARNVTVETDLQPEASVMGSDLLTIAVDNLIANTVDHLNRGATVRITVARSSGRSRAVELTVRDDGPGFPEDELLVHSQADETPLQHSEGIGLWLTRWIVEAHDGEFEIANDPQGGAIVTVRLPAGSTVRESPTGSDRSAN